MMRRSYFIIGSALLFFVTSLLMIPTAGFFAGYSLQAGYVGLATILTAIYTIFLTRQYFIELSRQEQAKMAARILLGGGLLMVTFMAISSAFYDVSYDGQVYHQEAIIQLAEGWNPLTDYITKNRSNPAMLLNHYAKGPWIYGAALYKATGHIEQSKAFNWGLMAAGFFLSLTALLQFPRINTRTAWFFSLILALNPVTVYQLFSFYIDGQLASLLLCLLALGWLLMTGGGFFIAGTLAMTLILLVNIKFTGVVYGGVAVVLLLIWAWALKKWTTVRQVLVAGGIGMLLGVLFAGYNPYLTNTLGFGHPFYPLYGSPGATMDIMTTNSPEPFLRMNALEKLAVATFSQSANKSGPEGLPVLKWPFAIYGKEMEVFLLGADVRVAGFGPWFGGAILVSGLALALGLGRMRKTSRGFAHGESVAEPEEFSRQNWRRGLLVILCVLISGLVNPESWWARYSPQYWFLPILTALLLIVGGERTLQWWGRCLGLVLAVNVALVSATYGFGNFVASQSFDRGIAEMKENPLAVAVNFREFPARRVMLREQGVLYSPLKTPPELRDIPYAADLAWKQWLRDEAAAAAAVERQKMAVGPAEPVDEEFFYEVDMRVFLDNCLWAAHLATGWSAPEK